VTFADASDEEESLTVPASTKANQLNLPDSGLNQQKSKKVNNNESL